MQRVDNSTNRVYVWILSNVVPLGLYAENTRCRNVLPYTLCKGDVSYHNVFLSSCLVFDPDKHTIRCRLKTTVFRHTNLVRQGPWHNCRSCQIGIMPGRHILEEDGASEVIKTLMKLAHRILVRVWRP